MLLLHLVDKNKDFIDNAKLVLAFIVGFLLGLFFTNAVRLIWVRGVMPFKFKDLVLGKNVLTVRVGLWERWPGLRSSKIGPETSHQVFTKNLPTLMQL